MSNEYLEIKVSQNESIVDHILIEETPEVIEETPEVIEETPEVIEDYFDQETKNHEFYEQIKRYITIKLQKPFTFPKIIKLVAEAIKFTSQINGLNDDDKKQLILVAIKDVVKSSPKIPEHEKENIYTMIDAFGDDVTDQIIHFANDTATFIKKTFIQKCSCCIPKRKNSSHNRSIKGQLGANLEEYEAIKQYMNMRLQKPITSTKIITLIGLGVKFAQKYKRISGTEKKNLVITVIHDVIDMSDKLNDEEKINMNKVVDDFADELIDNIVDVGRTLF